jgi:hypothetical protein
MIPNNTRCICDVYCQVEKICHQMWIIFQQNYFKYGVGQRVLRYIKLLFLFRIKKNCLSTGRNHSLYLVCITKVIKEL